MINLRKVERFIARRNVAFIASVDEAGFPNLKAMLTTGRHEGVKTFWFSTNTSSSAWLNTVRILRRASTFIGEFRWYSTRE